jgi:hypothetical protein
MHADQSQRTELIQRSLGFFGVLGASLSHEINNVMAILNELNGLMDDLLVAVERGRALESMKIKSIVSRVAVQVDRGKQLVQQLNKLSHSVDEPRCSLDPVESIERIVTMCRRLADLRRIDLELVTLSAVQQMQGSPFELQHAIFRCVEIALDSLAPGSSLKLEMLPNAKGLELVLNGGFPVTFGAKVQDKLALSTAQVSLLGGRLCAQLDGNFPLELKLFMPTPFGSLAEDFAIDSYTTRASVS